MSLGTKLCFSSLALLGTAWFGRNIWLEALGQYLTATDVESSSNADYAVVPAADYVRADVDKETLKEAVRLLHTGSVKHIVMSCPDAYGVSECELAEAELRDGGYPRVRLEWLRTTNLPDESEADLVLRWLTERDAKSVIVVLPNYKARRLGAAYVRRGAQSGIQVTLACQSREFDPERWWKSREGQKRFAEEFVRLARLL
jgi:hypothetical protein